jgi:hypothetical protein
MKILLAGEIAEWKTLEPSRWNQTYRNELAGYLRLVADRISNGQASDGAVDGIRWRLEPSIAKPADGEEAA